MDNGGCMDKRTAELILKQALNDPSAQFREGQWEAIDATVNKRQKTLVVQRTGWGKSAVYFISCKLCRLQNRGMTLIISPLLALMRNQIEAASEFGLVAKTINSANTDNWEKIKQEIKANQVDCLFVSPERLANEEFIETLLRPISSNIALMVIDEVHCISDWGHDFRPDYRRIVRILKQIPNNTPVLCTTATANNRVVEDIQQQLGNIYVQRGDLMRESLYLQAITQFDTAKRLAWIAEKLKQFHRSGIIYTLTIRDAELVSDWLQQNGIQAYAYYSNVTHPSFENSELYREYLEQQLKHNKIKALVATTALGMGYDKPDLSFVIHYQVPNSIISYYQQVGRAGRKIDKAIGVLMSGEEDEYIHHYFRQTAFPKERDINEILHLLEQSNGLSKPSIAKHINLSQGKIEQALKFLSLEDPAPIIKVGSLWKRTIHQYRLNTERITYLTQQREREWQEIQRYLSYNQCRMNFLRKALDDKYLSECGKCDVCLGREILSTKIDPILLQKATLFLKHSEEIIEPKKQFPVGSFIEYGFKSNIPAHLSAEKGRVLSRWGNGTLGNLVAQGKHSGYFDDALVDAMVEMMTQRWKPNPFPKWVCCIPSLNHPHLVPDFAKRLAIRLGLPFIDAIHKVKSNQPQKAQNNRFHQCKNLDGVFAVSAIDPSPVLLVDDVIDSGWTLTVVATLLREQGCSAVYPVALATSSIKE